MPKNYLVLKNYTIQKQFFIYTDTERVTRYYAELERLLVESAHEYLLGDWELIVHRETVQNDQQLFKDHMIKIKELWHSEPCNIFYMDLDTVFIKPTNVFDDPRLTDFTMVNCNCGVRYYPHTMDPELWKIQDHALAVWNTELSQMHEEYKWDFEQDIFQTMLEKVKSDPGSNNPMHELVWNCFNMYEGQGILHLNGTGQQFDTIKLTNTLLKYSRRNGYHAINQILNDPRHSTRQAEIDWHCGINEIELPDER